MKNATKWQPYESTANFVASFDLTQQSVLIALAARNIIAGAFIRTREILAAFPCQSQLDSRKDTST